MIHFEQHSFISPLILFSAVPEGHSRVGQRSDHLFRLPRPLLRRQDGTPPLPLHRNLWDVRPLRVCGGVWLLLCLLLPAWDEEQDFAGDRRKLQVKEGRSGERGWESRLSEDVRGAGRRNIACDIFTSLLCYEAFFFGQVTENLFLKKWIDKFFGHYSGHS